MIKQICIVKFKKGMISQKLNFLANLKRTAWYGFIKYVGALLGRTILLFKMWSNHENTPSKCGDKILIGGIIELSLRTYYLLHCETQPSTNCLHSFGQM